MKEEFIVVTWPDSQDLMELDGFRENSYLINDEKGLDDFGSSAYFVNKKWYEAKNNENCTSNIKSGLDEMNVLDNIRSQMDWLDKYKEEHEAKSNENCTPNVECSCCNDNRFEIIGAAKKDLLDSTNIDSDPEEMKVIDNILFRCWQMGWLDKYDNSKHDNERS